MTRELTGWCTRCGGECFNEVRHVCRKPAKDAAAMIATKQENERLKDALRDFIALLRGDLSGPSQVEGVLREAERLLTLSSRQPSHGGR